MPSNKSGATHCPAKSAACRCPRHFNVNELAIAVIAAARKKSDGILDVCFSIALVNWPSLYGFVVSMMLMFLVAAGVNIVPKKAL
jgi:hypothetical protein